MTSAEIKALVSQQGFQSVGICAVGGAPEGIEFFESWIRDENHAGMHYLARQTEIRRSLEHVLPGARSAIVVSLNYAQPVKWEPGAPRIARYALGRDYHRVMRQRLARAAKQISTTYPAAKFRACVDSAPIFERELAHRAGLGWFGKNTMLIDSRRGSWTLLGVLLTTLELEPDTRSPGGCGTCTRCIEACPTGAIQFTNGRWNVDARACISYWTIEHRGDIPVEIHVGIGDWTFGCDVCQEVCPFNQPRESQPLRAAETSDPDFLDRGQRGSLVDWANLEQADFERITSGSPLKRPGLVGLRRNARINLTNENPDKAP